MSRRLTGVGIRFGSGQPITKTSRSGYSSVPGRERGGSGATRTARVIGRLASSFGSLPLQLQASVGPVLLPFDPGANRFSTPREIPEMEVSWIQ